jgi:hypothetical protein
LSFLHQALCKFGRPGLPPSAVLWLALHDRYWMADRFERHRLPCPSACPFCNQAQESIAHLLLGCVLAREVWAADLYWWDREERLPPQRISIADWLQSWCGRAADVQDFRNGVALVCWCLWRHQNAIIFEGATPSSSMVVRNIRSEAMMWMVAGFFKAELALGDRWRLHE